MKTQKLVLSFYLFLSIIVSVSAQVVSPGIYTITNKNSNLCLAIRGATQHIGEEGTQWNCDGNADKKWKLIDAGAGYFKLQNQNSNLFLAVGGGSREYGGRCLQYVDQGQPDILWRFVDAGAGWYKIQNKNSGLFIAIGGGARTDGAELIQYGDEGQEDVKWKLTAVQTVSPGTYTITNKNSNLCLAIRGATRNIGEEGTQWNCDGNADKKWKLIDAGAGYFKLQNQNSNLFLAVGGGSREYGGRCLQYVDQGQQDILWRFVDAGAGWYKIQNKNSGLFIAIGGGSRADGAELIQYGDEGQEDVKWKLTSVTIAIVFPSPRLNTPLTGWVDMHTHPMAKWGFGEQLFFGDADGSPTAALGSCGCKHNFVAWPFDGNCGEQNLYRNNMVDEMDRKFHAPIHRKVAGFPSFAEWPKYNSVLHQQMWVDWIKRSYEGGLRVMVSLAVHNHCLADAAETGGANDDMRSYNTQIQKMKEFVGRHTDFMEIAYSGADLRRIVRANKLAIILGVESDNLGNFYSPADGKGGTYNANPTTADAKREIDRLFDLGVRYIFPIHLTNNAFGGSAVYQQGFNIANKYNTGRAFEVEAVDSRTGITFKLQNPFQAIEDLGVLAMNFTGTVLPGQIMPNNRANYPEYPDPGLSRGHRNAKALTDLGRYAIQYMMQKGMIIDVDHCSEKSLAEIIGMANRFDYPINSGHNGPRGTNGNENGRTNEQYQTIQRLGGMIGLGHGGNTNGFLSAYRIVMALTQGKQIAIGTDANGLEPLPSPPPANARIVYGGALTQCVMGSKTWDYNTEGVAHYGLMPDYIKSWEAAGMTTNEKNAFFSSAEYFAQMWEKCDRQKTNIR